MTMFIVLISDANNYSLQTKTKKNKNTNKQTKNKEKEQTNTYILDISLC